MRFPNVAIGLLGWLLGACTSLPPTPERFAANLPPARELTPEQAERAAELTAAALVQLRAGDHVNAQASAERALLIDARSARALSVLAVSRVRRAAHEDPIALGVLQRAEGELRLAERLAPDDPRVAALHAMFLQLAGHLTAAATRAERGLAVSPDDLELLELAGSLRHDLGDERRAIPHLRRLVGHRPGAIEARLRLAEAHAATVTTIRDALERASAVEAALESYRACVELAPSNPAARLGVAHALTLAGGRENLTEALDHLADAADLDARSSVPWFNRGVVLDRLERPADARAAYEAALARDGDHVPSLLNLAANQAAAEMFVAARATCERVLALALPDDDRRRIEQFLAGEPARRP